MKTLCLYVLLAFCFLGCTVHESKNFRESGAEQLAADWDGRGVAKKYTKITIEALEEHGVDMLDPGVKMKKGGFLRYCKRYNSLNKSERKQFWLMFISGLARLESDFDTAEFYEEKFKESKDPDSPNTISRGLLQMSIRSANNSVYNCRVDREEDLHLPHVNLNCAAKVMNHWVKKDRKIYGFKKYLNKKGKERTRWLGVGRYWAPIRVERAAAKRKERYLKLGKKTNSLSFCK